MRALQWCLHRLWLQYGGDLSDSIVISSTVAEVVWWGNEVNLCCGIALTPPPPVIMVVTAASTLGLGVHLVHLEIRGLWSKEEQVFHINLLELWAILLALKAFLPYIHGQSVQILMDNTTLLW